MFYINLLLLLSVLFPFQAGAESPPTLEINIDGAVMQFVLIRAGEFQMGCLESDLSEETPQHTVKISKDFYLGKFEVTQGQWQAVMGTNPSLFKGNSLPVEQVNWDECCEFAGTLTSRKIGIFRLPTEAEWEYAARAGTDSRYWWGTFAEPDYLWYYDNGQNRTHPVGLKKPNPWGLYDMLGNVWEWCRDSFEADYYQRSPVENPLNQAAGIDKVLRGGSFWCYPYFCRAQLRNHSPARVWSQMYGLRLVYLPEAKS
ncbi:MAG: formylglycine-generating enzyme family protein [Candidatus Wallbacteria bacterium]|nr:formylglycine-generating enzyme family protein [Candidatus Wallbacteria bacterium]